MLNEHNKVIKRKLSFINAIQRFQKETRVHDIIRDFRTNAILLMACLGCLFGSTEIVRADTAVQESDELIARLFEFPAPIREWELAVPAGQLKNYDGPPPENAPLQALVTYWMHHYEDTVPSAGVRQRLLEALEADPALHETLLRYIGNDEESLNRVHTLYEKQVERGDGEVFKSMRWWLALRGPWYREELEEAARKVRYDPETATFEEDEALRALAHLDMPRAMPIITDLEGNPDPHLRALGLGIHYINTERNTDADLRLRKMLQIIALQHSAPPVARATAIDALFSMPWERSQEFFDKLAQDRELMGFHSGIYLFEPLAQVVSKNPDDWIPHVTTLIGSDNRSVHDNAVTCLVQFHLRKTREDALRPLLPWLSDPSWSDARDRLRLIQSLDRTDIKESVEGLLRVIDKENGYALAAAADALARWPDPRAVPLLNKAFGRETNIGHRRDILHALIANDGLDIMWSTNALEKWAAHTLKEEKKHAFLADGMPPELSAGYLLANVEKVPETLITSVIKRSEERKETKPRIAMVLRQALSHWNSPQVTGWLVDELASGQASAEEIASLIMTQGDTMSTVAENLRTLRGQGGVQHGVAVLLTGTAGEINEILKGKDPDATRVLLAGARLIRKPLPLNTVGELLQSENGQLVSAAEHFLVSEDSSEARKLLLDAHPENFTVFGARSYSDPGHVSYKQLDRNEKELVDALRTPGGPDRIYALLAGGYWSSDSAIQVHVHGGEAKLVVRTDNASWASRHLGAAELKRLERFLKNEKVEELPPLETAVSDGVQVEFMELDRSGGYRLFMNNPGVVDGPGSVYARLTEMFQRLANAEPLQREFTVQHKIPGAKLIMEDTAFSLKDVWRHDGKLYALTQSKTMRADKKTEWRLVGKNAIEGSAEGPEGYPVLTDCGEDQWKMSWRSSSSGITVGIGNGELVKCVGKGKPQRLTKGDFATPVMSVDGRWAIVAHSINGWANPNDIVRIEVATGKRFPIAIAPADNLDPVAYVSAHNAILVLRVRDHAPSGNRKTVGPEKPEYYLVEPGSGKLKRTRGNFEPLTDHPDRALQPTNKSNEFWAAVADYMKNETVVGRYDTQRFIFTPVVTYPSISFDSDDMWVDELSETVYVAYESSVLSLPLNYSGE